MSESMMNFSNPYDGERVPGSVGPCLPGVKVRITDKNYSDVPIGTEGEILIKGPNVFSGYWNKPSYNKHCFKDEWFITGDVGKIDENTKKDQKKELAAGPDIVEKQAREQKENQKKVREYFKTQSRATNDDIQRILGVSDATATRYLEALEKEGLIRQVGGAGRGVYYEKI